VRYIKTILLAVTLPLLAAGCATLGALATLQPLTIESAPDRPSELRLLMPSVDRPLGGASVRLWARIGNPNAFGLTLARLDGALFLQEIQAAEVDFPFGLPLAAASDTVIPIDINVSFRDAPRLAEILLRGIERSELDYRMDGRMAVDAGRLGQPVFGPMTMLSGSVQVRR
jgi:hypothetical protein